MCTPVNYVYALNILMECYSTFNDVLRNNMTLGVPNSIFIFPGTKWCGDGNIANNYDDLGIFRDLDVCCREHKKCPQIIDVGETRYNITNAGEFISNHCDCDLEYYSCLKKTGTIESSIMGKMYFNGPHRICFKEEYPIVGCLSTKNFIFYNKCLVYELNETKNKLYQFFDLPYFI